MPDTLSDAIFRAALYRALIARAQSPEQAATLDRDGDALCRLLTGFLDALPPQTTGLCTVWIGRGGACKLERAAPDVD